MNVIVVGCGRVGSELAYRLFQKGHQVTVVDSSSSAFDNLPADFRGRTVEGEVLHQDVWRRAGIERADALAAVTNSDALNVVVGHLAQAVHHLPNVVTRNYDPRRRGIHEAFGLQVVSSSSWGAQRIEEMLHESALRTVFSAGNGEVEVYEFSVDRSWHGHPLSELLPDRPCSVVALTRAGQASIPAPDTLLEAGDILHVSATQETIAALGPRLTRSEEA
jgi:trk system potassium uptake protein TrkA